MKLCSVGDCDREAGTRGLCRKHYIRWWKHGTTELGRHQDAKENPNYKHGRYKAPEYRSWQAMKKRCYDPKTHNYYIYGGRGITVCDEWRNSFKNFYEDMGPRPPAHTIDRIDSDGNYEPGNCRWADVKTQSQNRKYNRTK